MWQRTATGKLIHINALRCPGERAYAARVGAPRSIARVAKITWRAQGKAYRPSVMVSIAFARASDRVMNVARRTRLNTKCYGPAVCILNGKGAITRALDHVGRMCAHMSTNMYTCMRNGGRHRLTQKLPLEIAPEIAPRNWSGAALALGLLAAPHRNVKQHNTPHRNAAQQTTPQHNATQHITTQHTTTQHKTTHHTTTQHTIT